MVLSVFRGPSVRCAVCYFCMQPKVLGFLGPVCFHSAIELKNDMSWLVRLSGLFAAI